jgi:ribosome biogenesis SPOUT family RNA methylase Rps3
VLTNFKEWIFTKYSLLEEVKQLIQAQGNETSINNVNPFEISEVYRVVKKEGNEESIDRVELNKVFNII